MAVSRYSCQNSAYLATCGPYHAIVADYGVMGTRLYFDQGGAPIGRTFWSDMDPRLTCSSFDPSFPVAPTDECIPLTCPDGAVLADAAVSRDL